MGKENFIEDAHHQPSDYVAYHVGRELAKLHPRKAIVECGPGYFDLEAFVRAERCFVVDEASIFSQIRIAWEGRGKELERTYQNAWLNVLWRGELLDVLLLTWSEGCYRARYHWIVANDLKLAEAFYATVCEWSCEVRGELLIFRDGQWYKSQELYESIKASTFNNLILDGFLKQALQRDFAQFFESRHDYEQYGIPWKRGALFIGPPGNGKTHAAKALVNQLGRPCLYVKGFKSEFETDQENIRAVFERARLNAPCLVLLEDLDAMVDESSRAFFLNELDGFEQNTGVLVLGTTNHPEKLDQAILNRPSRFDRKYYFDPPSATERAEYIAFWNAHLKPELRVTDPLKANLVKQTEGFSFAYLKELFLSSMMLWMASNQRSSMDDIVMCEAQEIRAQVNAGEQTSLTAPA